MAISHSDLTHLQSLIEAAQERAAAHGDTLRETVRLLGEALTAARAVEANDGRPDEGIRPEDLTTDNDK